MQFRGSSKIKGLLKDCEGLQDPEEATQTLVAYFIETISFNNGFGWYYFLCKFLATASPIFIWFYMKGFIGKLYGTYGIDVMRYIMDTEDPWPNPTDALFPKIAKCEWARYGYTGDLEIRAAQCQLPMNNLTEWSFFILWWWLALVLLVNLISLFYFTIMMFIPWYRWYSYRKLVSRVCREDIEISKAILKSNGKTKSIKLKDVLNVRISFGDWLVLYFLDKNLENYEYRAVVRQLAVTENRVLQLKKITPISHAVLNLPLPGAPPESEDGSSIGDIKMKLKNEDLFNGSYPPAYISTEEIELDQSLPGDRLGSVRKERPKSLKMGFISEAASPISTSSPFRQAPIRQPKDILLRRQQKLGSDNKQKGKEKLAKRPEEPKSETNPTNNVMYEDDPDLSWD